MLLGIFITHIFRKGVATVATKRLRWCLGTGVSFNVNIYTLALTLRLVWRCIYTSFPAKSTFSAKWWCIRVSHKCTWYTWIFVIIFTVTCMIPAVSVVKMTMYTMLMRRDYVTEFSLIFYHFTVTKFCGYAFHRLPRNIIVDERTADCRQMFPATRPNNER